MALDYLRTRKGIAFGRLVNGSEDVIIIHGDGIPYAQTASSLIANDDLSSSAKGSLYINDTTGKLYSKRTHSALASDWVEVGTGASTVSTQDAFQDSYMGKPSTGSVLPQYSTSWIVSDNDNLTAAIGKLDAEIGQSVLSVKTRSVGQLSDQAINRNINALDAAIGSNVSSTNYIFSSNAVNANLSILDNKVFNHEGRLATIETGLHWIDAVVATTGSSLATKSGLTALGDDNSIGYVFTANDRVVSLSNNTLYHAKVGPWSSLGTLTAGETFFTQYNFPDPSNQEIGAAYTYNGVSTVKIADFDFELATTIDIASGYAVTNGNVTAGDSVQAAIQKVDGNVRDIQSSLGIAQGALNFGTFSGNILTDNSHAKTLFQELETNAISNAAIVSSHLNTGSGKHTADQINMSAVYSPVNGTVSGTDTVQFSIRKLDGNQIDLTSAVGVAQGATNLGSWTGAGATDILTTTETAKTGIQKVANEIGSAVTAGTYIVDQTVNRNIQVLDTNLGDARKVITDTITAGNSKVVDIFATADFTGANYTIVAIHGTTITRRYKSEVYSLVSSAAVDYVETNMLLIPTKALAPKISVALSINSPNCELIITNNDSVTVNFKIIREVVRN
jgi:hypothetical protein